MKVRNGRKTLWVKDNTHKRMFKKKYDEGFKTIDELLNYLLDMVKKR